MRLWKILVPALLALAMLAGGASAIAAQGTPAPEGDSDLPEGLVKMYARSYTADMMAMFNPATPDAEPEGWFMLIGIALEFESEDAAAAGVDDLLAQLDAEADAAGDIAMEDVELDLDLDYTARMAQVEEEGMTSVVLQAIAQDGVYAYAVIGMTMGAGSDPVPTSEFLFQQMAAAEVGEAEETFDADGASEGGLWDKLPTVEAIQEQEPALATAVDEIYYPEDGAEAGS